MKKIFLLFALVVFSLSFSQVQKGNAFAFKTITTAEKTAYTPLAGERPIVFDSDLNEFYKWDGTVWNPFRSASGLEYLEEGLTGQGGWRLIDRDPDNYGDIGEDAVDFSSSTAPSSTIGATGEGSVAFGRNNTVSGSLSFVSGFDSAVSGSYSSAFGYFNNIVGGSATFISGNGNTSAGNSSAAIGFNNTIENGGYSIGLNNTAAGKESFIFGAQNRTESLHETAMGTWSTTYTPVGDNATWNGADRLLNIGNGESYLINSDAFTILKNGKTGIGFDNFETTVDSQLLQVNGDIKSTGSVTVADDAYDPAWDNNFEVPTKNALYDKLESLSSTLSVEDENAINQFDVDLSTEAIQFEGFNFDAINNRIENVQNGQVAYLDLSVGNDGTASLNNKTKPFLTMPALISALPTDDNTMWTIVISGTNVGNDIDMPAMPVRPFRFIADPDNIYDFNFETNNPTNVKSALESPIDTSFQRDWIFENGNISLKSALGYGLFFDNGTTYINIEGHIDNIEISNTATTNGNISANGKNLIINKITAQSIYGRQLDILRDAENIRIKEIDNSGFSNGVFRHWNNPSVNLIIDDIQSNTNLTIREMGNNATITFKNIVCVGDFSLAADRGKKVVFENTTFGAGVTRIVGTADTYTGKVLSDTPFFINPSVNGALFINFEGKFVSSGTTSYDTTINFEDSIISTDGVLFNNLQSVRTNPNVIFKGHNTINQTTTTNPIFIGTQPYNIENYGTLKIKPTSTLYDANGTLISELDKIDELYANLKKYTIATLPAGAQGDVVMITDSADTITYRSTVTTGGGAGIALVFFDGTNWIYH